MKLYINGQDIQQLILANVETQTLHVHKGAPETWLGAIDAYVSQVGVSKHAVDALYLVTGPGSPTALRSVLTIANTWRTFLEMKIYTLEKPLELSDQHAIDQLDRLAVVYTGTIILPAYSSAPKVTASKKDALGRKR
ncbi:MAG: hypothetical protein O3B64_03215 [bacterium]|nr:hypothetical protein [bacterium]